MRSNRLAILGFATVLFVVGAVAAHSAAKSNAWSADGYVYARMMLVDTGLSEESANALETQAFGWSAAPGDSGARGNYQPGSSRWFQATRGYPLFRARPLYPWLASKLYPRFGLRALRVVTASGAVIAAGALYVMLLLVAPWWLAACGAIATVCGLGDPIFFPLTDGLATGFWTASLAALAVYARRPSTAALIVSVVCAALLAVTRPEMWLPVGAAAGLAVAAWRANEGRRTAFVLLAAQLAVALGAIAFSAAVHGAGLSTTLHWQYNWQHDLNGPYTAHGFVPWYFATLAHNVPIELARLIVRGFPVLLLAVAAAGVVRMRGDRMLPVLVGAACATGVAFLATMNPNDLGRAFELPVAPVIMTAFFAAVTTRAARPDAARATSP